MPVQLVVNAQVQAQLHIDAGEAEQQQIGDPRFPKAAARGLRGLGRFWCGGVGLLRCYKGSIVSF